jgi:hypothetical protein
MTLIKLQRCHCIVQLWLLTIPVTFSLVINTTLPRILPEPLVQSFVTEADLTSSFKKKVKYFYDCFWGTIKTVQFPYHIGFTAVWLQTNISDLIKEHCEEAHNISTCNSDSTTKTYAILKIMKRKSRMVLWYLFFFPPIANLHTSQSFYF